MKEISTKDIRLAAMDLLARREHSRLELSRKLAKRFSGNALSVDIDEIDIDTDIDTDLEADLEAEIEVEIDKLTAEGLQSDSRMAEAFVRARTNRGQGPARIKKELRDKGVSDDLIALAIESCDIDWFELVSDVARKKFGDTMDYAGDMKAKARLSRFLQGRGFSFDHISSLF